MKQIIESIKKIVITIIIGFYSIIYFSIYATSLSFIFIELDNHEIFALILSVIIAFLMLLNTITVANASIRLLFSRHTVESYYNIFRTDKILKLLFRNQSNNKTTPNPP